uniref:Aspartic peptidase DDI1-type domain-containing protein n=1 Tax=Nymphaea colorata TaxID=210225 RepID=A0A5K1C523_9MAGN
MVDTGATHNFISEEEVGRLGLTRGKGESRVKAVNSEARPIYAIVRDAVVKIEGWSGRANFSVVQTDDFQMILGMEFLCASKMVPMPHLRSVSIMDERHPCMVPAVPTRKDKGKAVVVSTLQQSRAETLTEASQNETSPCSEDRRPSK